MQKILIFLFCLVLLTFPKAAEAHLAGQPPFFKINGQYSGLYPVPISSTQFDIPQDIAPQNYQIGESINFEIDTQALQIPQDVVAKSTFVWKYGDGTTGSGLKSSHTYNKQGSYILTIDVSYGEVPEPTLLQSVVLNIVPDKNYKTPTVQIKVDGKGAKDPIVDIFPFKYDQQLTFQADTTVQQGADIKSYTWDFNDNQTSNEQKVTHAYKNSEERSQYFPIVRVQDSNGFFADSYVQLSADPNYVSKVKKTNNYTKYLFFGLVTLLVISMGALFLKGSKKSK